MEAMGLLVRGRIDCGMSVRAGLGSQPSRGRRDEYQAAGPCRRVSAFECCVSLDSMPSMWTCSGLARYEAAAGIQMAHLAPGR